MGTRRNASQTQYERSIFEAFLAAHPSFAARVQEVGTPCDEFPDVVTKLADGASVEWELGEWLDPSQMAAGKATERIEAEILRAIGDQGPNGLRHILFCMLSLQSGVTRFDGHDRAGFKEELLRLIKAVDAGWPQNQSCQSPQGYRVTTFEEYPRLKKYLVSVHFEPCVVGGKRRKWPFDQPWIVFEGRGGAYDPNDAVAALARVIKDKAVHYGTFGEKDVRLIVFYNQAILYNTPFQGLANRTFADVAAIAARILGNIDVPFTKVYLLKAPDPDPEAFEVYPGLRQCD